MRYEDEQHAMDCPGKDGPITAVTSHDPSADPSMIHQARTRGLTLITNARGTLLSRRNPPIYDVYNVTALLSWY